MPITSVVYTGSKKTVRNKMTVVIVLLASLSACNTINTSTHPTDTVATGNLPAHNPTANCLLPSQVQKRAPNFTFLAPRQTVKVSPSECKTRGGEILSRI